MRLFERRFCRIFNLSHNVAGNPITHPKHSVIHMLPASCQGHALPFNILRG